MPLLEPCMNSIRWSNSFDGFSFFISSIAWAVLRSDIYKNLYASLIFSISSRENRALLKPIRLTDRTTDGPLTSMYGGTSLLTPVNPPMSESVPIRQN